MTDILLKRSLSYHLLSIYSFIFFLSAGVLWFYLPFAVWLKILAILLLALPIAYVIALQGLCCLPHSIIEIRVLPDQTFLCQQRDGHVLLAIITYTWVHPALTILSLQSETPSKRFSLLLLPDAIHEESFRQLRVRLRGF